jgi:hypothetical protein
MPDDFELPIEVGEVVAGEFEDMDVLVEVAEAVEGDVEEVVGAA